MNFSGLDRILCILKLMTKKEKITRANKYISMAFLSKNPCKLLLMFNSGILGIYFAYAEFSIFEKENITLLIKPHTYTYSNLSVERLTNFFNSIFYLLSFIASLEIFVRIFHIRLSGLNVLFVVEVEETKLFVFGRQCDIFDFSIE